MWIGKVFGGAAGMMAVVGILGLGGCNDFLAEKMVAAPNGMRVQREMGAGAVDANGAGGVHGKRRDRELRIEVGPPSAVIAAWVKEPKDALKVRGTILLLHGFLNDHSQMEGAAKGLVEAGYRAVLVDLRGHGDSTGDHITYGVDDARDLGQVVTYLQGQGLCGEKVGVFGASYGAATAILFAGADARVAAVVAVAPFDTLRGEAPYFGKHLLPMPGLLMSDADYVYVVNRMGKVASFDPDASSPLSAIGKTKAPVRLFHGTMDMIIPYEASERLAAAAPGRTELTLYPGQGHLELCFDVMGELRPATREWFDRYLGAGG